MPIASRYALNLDATLIADWNTYLSVQAEAAATLTGLVFVAVSINLSKIPAIPGLTGRAAESILQLFGVVIISTTVLIPRQPQVALGVEILVIGAFLRAVQTMFQLLYMRKRTGHPRHWVVSRVIQTQFANIPFFVAGILVLHNSPAGMYWLAPGCIFSLFSGVVSAWVLLIEILR